MSTDTKPRCGGGAEHDHWRSDKWPCPKCSALEELDRRGPDVNLERDVVRRLVRVETRLSQALRCLGIRPGQLDPSMAPSTVTIRDGQLIVSGADVNVGDIALAAIVAGLKGPVPIIVANLPWGTFTAHESDPRNEQCKPRT